jgi:hypothetical protein
MLGKSFSILFAIGSILFLGVTADAYFLSATDGTHLFLFEVTRGSNGRLAVTSTFEYDAPGLMGSTALIPSPQSTTAKLVFDLFGNYDAPGKPIVFRDHLEFDPSTHTWRLVSRKKFLTHKLDSYNLFSGSASEDERFLLTENGSLVNKRLVTLTGKLKGKNEPTFKNPTTIDPLSAALTPNGNFAVQSFFARSSAPQQGSTTSPYGLSVEKKDGQRSDFGVASEIVNIAISEAADLVCLAFKDIIRGSSSPNNGSSASDKTGVSYVRFDANTLQPIEQVRTISRKVSTPLSAYEIFNTTVLVPDGTAIIFAKQKAGKLEYRVQPLDGSCGPKKGGTYPLLQVVNPIVRDHLPLHSVSAAAAWCEQVGLC